MGKTEELVDVMIERRFDIIGLSETRLKGKDKKTVHENFTLIHSSDDSGRYGVAFLIHKDLSSRVSHIKYVDDRIIAVSLKLEGQELDIIQVYAPQQGRPDREKEDFYEQLEATIDRMPHRDNLLIIGDFNGHVGNDRRGYENVIGAFGIGDRNRDGERILDFCARNQLSVMNTFFQHRPSHKWTWYRWNRQAEEETSGNMSMIDFVLTTKKALIADVKVIPSVSMDSDHRAVVAKIKMVKPRPIRKPKRMRLKIERLSDAFVREELATKISQIAPGITEMGVNIHDQWNHFRRDVFNATKEVVGETYVGGIKRKQTPYWTQEVKEAVQEKNKAFRRWMKFRTQATKDDYVRARNRSKNIISKAKEEAWTKIGNDLDRDYCGTKKLLYAMAKTYRNKKQDTAVTIKDKHGTLLTDPRQIDKRWAEYFKDLMNVPEDGVEVDEQTQDQDHFDTDSTDNISIEEVQKAIKKMANNKSPGIDQIPSEVYKHGGNDIIRWMTAIFNTAWMTGEVPDDWGRAVICPVYKKGDRQECGNYRGISLLPHISKIYERVVENRLREVVEEKIGEWQHGYRPNKSTVDLIFALKMISEKTWEFNSDTYVTFLDLQKAFDRVPRNKLWSIMSKTEYGIPFKLRQAVKGMYKYCVSAVRPNTKESIWFEVKTGVRQGSVLSPLLFILMMDQVMRSTEQQLEQDNTSETMVYADDVSLVTGSAEKLQATLDVWCTVLSDHGLKLNVDKSEVMLISRIPRQVRVTALGTPLRQTNRFKYLGIISDSDANNESAINDRINVYSKNVGMLYPLLKDKHVPQKVKITIYKTILRPLLLYGHECWTLTVPSKSRIQAAEMRVLRLIKGVTRRDRIRNENIRRELGVKSILTVIEEGQLRWYGHVRRMDDTRIPKRWFDWRPSTRRPVGRPRKRWMGNIEEAVEQRRSTLQDIERRRLFDDRRAWRLFWTDRSHDLPGVG